VIPVLLQIGCYGLVGLAATLVHISAALTLFSLGHLPLLWANFLAFLTAFGVSYWGNWKWTFTGSARHSDALPKFFCLSLVGFLLNQALIYVTAIRWQWSFTVSIISVAFTLLAVGFVVSRYWAYVPVAVSNLAKE
jgi:putative flippase GtrA